MGSNALRRGGGGSCPSLGRTVQTSSEDAGLQGGRRPSWGSHVGQRWPDPLSPPCLVIACGHTGQSVTPAQKQREQTPGGRQLGPHSWAPWEAGGGWSVTVGFVVSPPSPHDPPLLPAPQGWASLRPGRRPFARASPMPAFFILAHLPSIWISHPMFLSGRIPGLRCPEFFCVRECLPLAFFSKGHLAKPDPFPSSWPQTRLCRPLPLRRGVCEVGVWWVPPLQVVGLCPGCALEELVL